MPYKNILVHLADDPRNEQRLKVAISLADQHESHLTALYTVITPVLPAHVIAYVPTDIIEKQKTELRALAATAREKFEAACEKAGVSYEWRQDEGDPVDLLAMHSRYADICIIGQPDPDNPIPTMETLPHELVLISGRPVLVVPYAGKFNKVGSRVLIAWNATRESTRAVHDALPILKGAKKAIVFSVNPSKRDHIPGADIAAHLARHGVKVEASHTVANDIDVGDALLAAASDRGVDLIVMGSWGHSRMRELVMGGATHELLEQMTVPVLLSH